MSYSSAEVLNRERLAQVSILESFAKFTEKVIEGEATPEQIAYMSEMAKIFDQEKYERIKREVHHRLGSSLDFLSLL